MEAKGSCGTSAHINQTEWHPSRGFMLYSLLLQVCVLFFNLIRFFYLGRWVGVGHWTEIFLLQTAAVALPLLPVVFPMAWLILDALGMARIQALVHLPSQSQVSKRNLLLKSTNECKKAVPLQAWTGPEGSRKLRLPDFVTAAQNGGKVVSLMHRPPLPPGNTPGTHFC